MSIFGKDRCESVAMFDGLQNCVPMTWSKANWSDASTRMIRRRHTVFFSRFIISVDCTVHLSNNHKRLKRQLISRISILKTVS